MAELKVKLPKELEEELKELPRENWAKVALEAIKSRVFELELRKSRRLRHLLFKAIISESKFTEKDALELGRKINLSMFKDLKSKGLV